MATKYDPWGIGSYSSPTIAPTPTMPTPGQQLYPLVAPTLYTPRLGSTGFSHFPGSSGIAPAGRTTDYLNQQYGLNALAGLNGAASPLTTNAGAPANLFTTLRNVKSPEQEARIGQVAGDFDAARTSTGNALADFTKKFLGNTPAAERNTAQENAVVEGYYSGDVGNTLAGLRAKRAAAVETAGNRGLEYAKRDRTSTQLLGDGTGNTYWDRLGIKAAVDQRVKEAVEQAELEQKHWDYVQANKLGLRGAQTNALDALAGRALVPADAQNRALAELMARLESVGRLDLANTFYGLQKPYDPNTEGYISDMSGGGSGYFGGPRRQSYSNQGNQPAQNRGPFGIGATVSPPAANVVNPNYARWNLPQADYSNMNSYPLLTPQYQVNPGQSVPPGSEYLDPIAGNIQGSSYLDQYYGYPGYFDQYAPGGFNNVTPPPSAPAPPYVDPFAGMISNEGYLDQYYGNYT